MACDAVATIPMVGCCAEINTDADYWSTYQALVNGPSLGLTDQQAYNLGKQRIEVYPLENIPFEFFYSQTLQSLNPEVWIDTNGRPPSTQPGPSRTGPGIFDQTMNSVFVSQTYQGAKFRFRFTAPNIYWKSSLPFTNSSTPVIEAIRYEAGSSLVVVPLKDVNGEGPWQYVTRCSRVNANYPAAVRNLCTNLFA